MAIHIAFLSTVYVLGSCFRTLAFIFVSVILLPETQVTPSALLLIAYTRKRGIIYFHLSYFQLMTQIRIDAALCALGVNRDGAVFDYDDYDYVLTII